MDKSGKVFAIAVPLLLVLAVGAIVGDRSVLWGVVQVCVANHRLTGAAFPCLEVDMPKGASRGFAVVRAPLQATHVVVVPTARIKGIEQVDLQAPTAPNYFEDAWEARHYVVDHAPRPLGRDDIGLAVNSLAGRSQDQLHIHVDCVRSDVKATLRAHQAEVSVGSWARLRVPLRRQRYWATKLRGNDLAGVNIFKLAAGGLSVEPPELQNLTIVVIGAVLADDSPGFYVLADLDHPGRRQLAHGEFLLDHACIDRPATASNRSR